MKIDKILTISYIPLYQPQRRLVEIVGKRQRKAALKEIFRAIKDAEANHLTAAQGCLWFVNEEICPVFVMQQGRDIVKHLMWWSQDHPHKFFEYCMYYDIDDGWYSAALMPNFKQTKARVSWNMSILEPDINIPEAMDVIFLPLHVFSKGPTVRNMLASGLELPQPGATVNVGILDSALINYQAAGDTGFDVSDIHWLHDIPVGSAASYLKSLYSADSEPNTNK